MAMCTRFYAGRHCRIEDSGAQAHAVIAGPSYGLDQIKFGGVSEALY